MHLSLSFVGRVAAAPITWRLFKCNSYWSIHHRQRASGRLPPVAFELLKIFLADVCFQPLCLECFKLQARNHFALKWYWHCSNGSEVQNWNILKESWHIFQFILEQNENFAIRLWLKSLSVLQSKRSVKCILCGGIFNNAYNVQP